MSQAKRRSADMAPGLFPFMAVLLCLIGALVLILAITVTQSHASARRDAEVALMEAESRSNTAIALSEDLLAKRDQLRMQVEERRAELQHVEDHLKRLEDEFRKVQGQLIDLSSVDQEKSNRIEQAKDQIDALKKEIEERQKELEELKAGNTDKKPAFSIIPYSGRNGTTRRPIYIECTKDGIVLQPEGIVIAPRDLIPPGAGNPLSVALRMLRADYEKQDREVDRLAPPPYPLLLVRPDGIEAYAYARQALADWDDQFGYELVDEEMELAFPPSVPGTKDKLTKVIDDAKRRQIALLKSDPQMARKYELREDMWPDEMTNGHPRSSFNGLNNAAAASDEFLRENGDGWKMIQAAPSPAGSDVALSANAGNSNLPFETQGANAASTNPAYGATTPSNSGTGNTLPNSFAAGMNLPNSASLQPVGSGASHENGLVLGDASGTGGTSHGANDISSGGATNSFGNAGSESGGPSDASQGMNSLDGSGSPGGNSASGSMASNSGAGGASSGSDAKSGGAAGGGGGTSSIASNMEPTVDPLDPNASQSAQSISTSVQLGSSSEPPKPKYVNPDGDTRPIAFTAGKDWAQSKTQGKATPISRTINIVALNDKWYVRREGKSKEFDAIINLSDGPQKVSDALAAAIREQVDMWGLAISGGYWVPQITVEAASDAEVSVERMKMLLDGSGVTLKVEPLQLK